MADDDYPRVGDRVMSTDGIRGEIVRVEENGRWTARYDLVGELVEISYRLSDFAKRRL